MASIIYSLIGIMIMIIYVIITGQLLSRFFGRLYKKLACIKNSAASNSTDINDDIDTDITDNEMIDMKSKRRNVNYNDTNTNSINRRQRSADGQQHGVGGQDQVGVGVSWNHHPAYSTMGNGHIG